MQTYLFNSYWIRKEFTDDFKNISHFDFVLLSHRYAYPPPEKPLVYPPKVSQPKATPPKAAPVKADPPKVTTPRSAATTTG
jgi:hypothetical protein